MALSIMIALETGYSNKHPLARWRFRMSAFKEKIFAGHMLTIPAVQIINLILHCLKRHPVCMYIYCTVNIMYIVLSGKALSMATETEASSHLIQCN